MKRRDFLRNSVFIPALGITLVYSLTGCSSDDDTATVTTMGETTGTEPAGTCTTASAEIGSNHGHTITPPSAAQVTAGEDITLNLTIGAGHTHSVTLTAADLANLSMCGTVKNTSSFEGHSHQVTFTGIS